jgi:hypothetical protein
MQVTNFADDAVQVLTEYRRLYEEHWSVAQSARSLTPVSQTGEAYERARVVRGEVSRLFPQVERHLRAVGIDPSEVTGGVRPAALDRVIAVAIERHRDQQAREAPAAQSERASPTRPSRSALVLLASLAVVAAGGFGWGLVIAGWL